MGYGRCKPCRCCQEYRRLCDFYDIPLFYLMCNSCGAEQALLDMETSRLGVEDHSRLLRQVNLHEGLIACCLEVS